MNQTKTLEIRTNCQPISITPFRPDPFKFSPCPKFAVATSSDKSGVWVQTGRSLQLQDASVGGPKEGCRALFIQREMQWFERSVSLRNTQGSFHHHIPFQRWDASHECGCKKIKTLKISNSTVYFFGNVSHWNQGSCWSPRRALVQSDYV